VAWSAPTLALLTCAIACGARNKSKKIPSRRPVIAKMREDGQRIGFIRLPGTGKGTLEKLSAIRMLSKRALLDHRELLAHSANLSYA
jgi:hypothetical protein